jgi:hypothetical protein
MREPFVKGRTHGVVGMRRRPPAPYGWLSSFDCEEA